MSTLAMHASAPEQHLCADCTMDKEACPVCYAAWWKRRHPNTMQVVGEAVQSATGRSGVFVPQEVWDWLMGEEGDFKPSAKQLEGSVFAPGRYWWRSELRRRVEAAADKVAKREGQGLPDYPLALVPGCKWPECDCKGRWECSAATESRLSREER